VWSASVMALDTRRRALRLLLGHSALIRQATSESLAESPRPPTPTCAGSPTSGREHRFAHPGRRTFCCLPTASQPLELLAPLGEPS
jgi:hypothetical protein